MALDSPICKTPSPPILCHDSFSHLAGPSADSTLQTGKIESCQYISILCGSPHFVEWPTGLYYKRMFFFLRGGAIKGKRNVDYNLLHIMHIEFMISL